MIKTKVGFLEGRVGYYIYSRFLKDMRLSL